MIGILVRARRIADAPVGERPRVDLVGAVLSALGLGAFVYGVLRSDEWGWFPPKPGEPSWLGVSLVVWLMLAGLLLIRLFLRRGPGSRSWAGSRSLIRACCTTSSSPED